MQTFTGPDGKDYDFPDNMSVDQIKGVFRQKFGGPDQTSTAGDMAKSAGIGVVKGGIGLAGFPGDVGALGDSLTNKLGINGYIDSNVDSLAGKDSMIGGATKSIAHALLNPGSMLPSSSDIQSLLEQKVTGPLYQPKTTAGEYAQTFGEFLPGLLTGGEGLIKDGVQVLSKDGLSYLAKQLAKRTATDVAAPAITSEAAGQLSEGTAAEPYARLAGALLGGGLGKAGSSIMDAAGAPKVPSMDAVTGKAVDVANKANDIKTAAQDAYKAADDAGVVLAPTGMKSTFDGMKAKILADSGLPQINSVFADKFPNIKANIAALDDVAKGPVSLMGLDKLRQTLRDLPTTASDAEQRYASQMVKGLDTYVNNLTPADVVSGKGPTQEAVDALTNARKLYRDSSVLADKTKIISDAIEKAKDMAGANSTANDINTKVRQQFRALKDKMRKDEDVANLFSGDEKKLIDNVVNGTDAENSMRYWSNMVPDKLLNYGITGGLGGAALSSLGGPIGPVAGGAGALAAALVKGGQALAAHGAEKAQRGTLDDLMNALMNDGKAVPSGRAAPTTVPNKLLNLLAGGGKVGVLGTTDSRTGN